MFRSDSGYVEHNLYNKYGNITFNNTNTIYKHINNYSNDVTNNYKINKISNVNKPCYNFNDDTTLNKTSNSYSNDTYNITKTNSLFNITDNQYFTNKIHNTSNITNNITRHINTNHDNNIHKRLIHI